MLTHLLDIFTDRHESWRLPDWSQSEAKDSKGEVKKTNNKCIILSLYITNKMSDETESNDTLGVDM